MLAHAPRPLLRHDARQFAALADAGAVADKETPTTPILEVLAEAHVRVGHGLQLQVRQLALLHDVW